MRRGLMAKNPDFGTKPKRSARADAGARPSKPAPRRPARRSGPSLRFGFLVAAIIAAAAAFPFLTGASPAPDLVAYFTPADHSQRAGAISVARQFEICDRGKRITCVVDGDTFWLDGEKIRIADINTPETSSPGCAAELQLGKQATTRLQSLLNAGPFELRRGERDQDVYGRKLRTVHRDGRSVGELLVADGLAHEWRGHKESWCG